MSAEFKKGDLVTFNAYKDESTPAKVVEVISVAFTGLTRYRLEGAEKSKPLMTYTTGRCIKESEHFVEPQEFVW